MTPSFQGVAKILRFNWPWYALALALNAAAALWLSLASPAPALRVFILVGLALADFWLLASLAVSHWIYDRSGIARAAWLESLAPHSATQIAVFHAGHDEASQAIAERFPTSALQVFDFFQPDRPAEPSLRRARALARSTATLVSPAALPLGDGAIDLVFLVFSAHEMRALEERAVFFAELRRVLKSGGQVRVVEHLRDGWNALAYGPGCFHFLPRTAWLDTFAASGWVLRQETRCTLFITIFQLEGTL